MRERVVATTARAWLILVCLTALLPLLGCGSKGPPTVSVTGTVQQGGQPVEGATVMFSRGGRDISKGEIAMGKTDAQGRFTLITHLAGQKEAQGALPGKYEVTISKRVPPPGVSESQYQAMVEAANKIGETGAMVPKEKQPPELVEKFPPKFSAIGKSELTADVAERGPNEFPFDLK